MRQLTTPVRFLIVGSFAVAALVGLPSAASAQGPQPGGSTAWPIGIRAGFGHDPNQVIFGAQIESPGLTQSGHLTFRPSATIGAGDDHVVFNLNVDILFYARIPDMPLAVFFGGGPGVGFDRESIGEFSHSEFRSAHSIVVGAQTTSGLIFEYRVFAGTAHDFQALVGFVLKR